MLLRGSLSLSLSCGLFIRLWVEHIHLGSFSLCSICLYFIGVFIPSRYLFFQTTGNIHNFCEVGLKIAGIVPIYSPPALTYSHTLLTSVAVSTTEQHTVAFLGTSDGHMKKVKKNLLYILG